MITKDDIHKVEEQLYDAMRSSNLDVPEMLLHKDLLFLAPSGETLTKEMDIETYRVGKLKITELNSFMEKLQIIDNLAVVTLEINIKGIYDSQSFDTRNKYIRVWKRFDERLRVVGGGGVTI